MYTIKTNNKEYTIELQNEQNGLINNASFSLDKIKINDNTWHVIQNNKSYTVELIKINYEDKTATLRVNNNNYGIVLTDKYDALLKSLGLENLNTKKINEIKAPMPGLVLDIKVKEGDVVKKGDVIIVLEAMKMENNLKSPTDGIVKKINVQTKNTVEKNQVLLQFE